MTVSLEALLGPALLIQVLILVADGTGLCTLFGNSNAATVEWQCNCHYFVKCINNKHVVHQPLFHRCKLPWLTHPNLGDSLHPTQAVPKQTGSNSCPCLCCIL